MSPPPPGAPDGAQPFRDGAGNGHSRAGGSMISHSSAPPVVVEVLSSAPVVDTVVIDEVPVSGSTVVVDSVDVDVVVLADVVVDVVGSDGFAVDVGLLSPVVEVSLPVAPSSGAGQARSGSNNIEVPRRIRVISMQGSM